MFVEPFLDKRRDTLRTGYYCWPLSETKATEDAASLVKAPGKIRTGECRREGTVGVVVCVSFMH